MAFDANRTPTAAGRREIRAIANVNKATPQQVAQIRLGLHREWTRVVQRASAADEHPTLADDYALSQADFDYAYMQMLLTLAAYGSSESLSDHPDLEILATRPPVHVQAQGGAPAHDEDQPDVVAFWPLRGIKTLLRLQRVATVRRFARAEADLVYDYLIGHVPEEMTPWHRTSGMAEQDWAIAFDFADYISQEKLSLAQQAAIQDAKKYSIRATAGVLNRFDAGGRAIWLDVADAAVDVLEELCQLLRSRVFGTLNVESLAQVARLSADSVAAEMPLRTPFGVQLDRGVSVDIYEEDKWSEQSASRVSNSKLPLWYRFGRAFGF